MRKLFKAFHEPLTQPLDSFSLRSLCPWGRFSSCTLISPFISTLLSCTLSPALSASHRAAQDCSRGHCRYTRDQKTVTKLCSSSLNRQPQSHKAEDKAEWEALGLFKEVKCKAKPKSESPQGPQRSPRESQVLTFARGACNSFCTRSRQQTTSPHGALPLAQNLQRGTDSPQLTSWPGPTAICVEVKNVSFREALFWAGEGKDVPRWTKKIKK